MVELEMTFEKLEREVKDVNKNAEELKRTYLNLTELRSMLKKTQQFFDEVGYVFFDFKTFRKVPQKPFSPFPKFYPFNLFSKILIVNHPFP